MKNTDKIPVQLDVLNCLYLELSTVATATTGKELKLHEGIGNARQAALDLRYALKKLGNSSQAKQCLIAAAKLEASLNGLLP